MSTPVEGSPATPSATEAFAAFGLSPELLAGVADAGYQEPRPIQRAAIPAILAGRDLLGLAQTGTGKTAAFALPILERLARGELPEHGIGALVVAPTRELAAQIEQEFRTLGAHLPLRTATVFGGVPQRQQERALARDPQVVVACPGRLLDLMRQRLVRLDQVRTFVLDEADRLLEMGFLQDIRRIVAALPRRRQSLLFSATMPPAIRGLANELLAEPEVVEFAPSRPVESVVHRFYPVDRERRAALLFELLDGEAIEAAIIFMRTKHQARRLARRLTKRGLSAAALEGDMNQRQRERTLASFRTGRVRFLVATDIAARGIDVPHVSHVINFDAPANAEDYTHRIGRTGRAGRSGTAITLLTVEDRPLLWQVEHRLGRRVERVVQPGYETLFSLEPTRKRRRRPRR